eukprot:TRINITY_DN2971_c0_g2_i1.p1 TRINITY_DN2971_c0_g2~~TRINITY_DN2971_c0_g2_i1.p1  ORF type:complete len:251 (+),score=68.30 TRINITY_DN2971_c0_g2_i1:31-783(+)
MSIEPEKYLVQPLFSGEELTPIPKRSPNISHSDSISLNFENLIPKIANVPARSVLTFDITPLKTIQTHNFSVTSSQQEQMPENDNVYNQSSIFLKNSTQTERIQEDYEIKPKRRNIFWKTPQYKLETESKIKDVIIDKLSPLEDLNDINNLSFEDEIDEIQRTPEKTTKESSQLNVINEKGPHVKEKNLVPFDIDKEFSDFDLSTDLSLSPLNKFKSNKTIKINDHSLIETSPSKMVDQILHRHYNSVDY